MAGGSGSSHSTQVAAEYRWSQRRGFTVTMSTNLAPSEYFCLAILNLKNFHYLAVFLHFQLPVS